MSAHQSFNSLLTRIQLASQMDDCTKAWSCLSQALGVPAEETHKTMSALISPVRWAEKSPADRHFDLLIYIETTLKRDTPPPKNLAKFNPPGFRISQYKDRIGLVKYLPDGSKWRLFAHGPFLPQPGETITAQHMFDTYIDFEETYTPGNFIFTDFLDKVSHSENSTDAFERALKRFTSTKQEMSGKDFGNLIGDASWFDDETKDSTVLVYDNTFWIDVLPTGYALTLENQGWVAKPDELHDLEKHLFSFSLI